MKQTTNMKPNKLVSPKAGRFNVVASTLAASLICTGIVSAGGAVLSGGNNIANGSGAVIASGFDNRATGTIAVVVGGAQNWATNQGGVVIAGFQHVNSGFDTVIITGEGNTSETGVFRSAIVAGKNNNLLGGAVRSFIGAGENNVISGENSAIVAGTGNVIGSNGENSQAGGVNASANHANCFVFNSDAANPLATTGDGQYLINARVGIGTNDPSLLNSAVLAVQGNAGNISSTTIGSAATFGGSFTGQSANGTATAPQASANNDFIAAFRGRGHDGLGYPGTKAAMTFHAAQNWTSTAQGTDIRFSTTDNNTDTLDERMRITHDGRVGIGTTDPTRGKVEIVGSAGSYFGPGWVYTNDGTGQGFVTGPFGGASLWCSEDVVARNYSSVSDKRIKQIEGRSDAARDLTSLLGIEVTDYSHIDIISKGTGKQKKVIAQQVETVFPQAVNRTTDAVPDIYKKAPIANGWVEFATDLKVGERVRLIGEKEEGVHEVLEVRDGAFRTAFEPASEVVFVFGREVDDFRTVDYDAISMLNVSATQEIHRKVEALEVKNTAMSAELTKLRATNEALTKKLAAVDALTEKLARLEQVIGRDNGAQRISTVIDLKASN